MQISLSNFLSQRCRQSEYRQPARKLSEIMFIGSYAPRQCGIATFAQDLRRSMIAARPTLQARVAMMAEECGGLHPAEVEHTVVERERASYAGLRNKLNAAGTEAVSLQHEYGIFGGPDGAWILDTLRDLRAPVVTTCHTVLENPSLGQRQVLCEIGRLSARMVVMTLKGSHLLTDVYGVPESKIAVVPHGIPDIDPASLDREALRQALGWTGRKVMLTTGMLSPNKGLQHVIAALPRVLATHPDVIYVVAGATHPNLVRGEGEAYRKMLMDLAKSLGVAGHVRFIDRFIPRDQLVDLIVASDLFATPYLNEAQITSGVLAYASGLGKPVIATPYWHARELLDASRGVLVPFAAPKAIAEAAVELFGDPERMHRMSQAACKAGRQTTWLQTGRHYLQLFDGLIAQQVTVDSSRPKENMPAHPQLRQLHRLTGPLGIYQHANHEEPEPEHGPNLTPTAP